MNINSHTTLSGLGAFPQMASVGQADAVEGQGVPPGGVADRPSVTVVQNGLPTGVGDVEVPSAVEADIGFNDDVARLFGGYAFTEDEIPPLNLERGLM